MTKKKSESEIHELQEQVEKLGSKGPTQKEHMEKPPEKPVKEKVDSDEYSELRDKIEEFADLMKEELNQIPATTAIAIFALGFVFGRLMSK